MRLPSCLFHHLGPGVVPFTTREDKSDVNEQESDDRI